MVCDAVRCIAAVAQHLRKRSLLAAARKVRRHQIVYECMNAVVVGRKAVVCVPSILHHPCAHAIVGFRACLWYGTHVGLILLRLPVSTVKGFPCLQSKASNVHGQGLCCRGF